MNYRGFGLAWLAAGLLALAVPAAAVDMAVGALGLNVAEVWQRGSSTEENDLDSLVLRMGSHDTMLEIFLPRHRTKLKGGEGQFMDQLERSWRRRYGDRVQLDWLEVAGTRWRICRRPSQSGDGQVFQIVTMHGGEIYQLVAVAPVDASRLPIAVKALLESATWDVAAAERNLPLPDMLPSAAMLAKPDVPPPPRAPEAPAKPAAVPAAPVAATPAAVPEPMPAPAAGTPAPVPAASAPVAAVPPAPAPAAPPAAPAKAVPAVQAAAKWRLLRSVMVAPGGKEWPALAEAEGRLLGSDGPVTGLGLSGEANALDGFLEGYLWRKDDGGHEHREMFRRHWRVAWRAVPETWTAGEALAVDLDLAAETVGLASAGGLDVDLELAAVCAPRLEVVRWLDNLEARGVAGLPDLAKMACPGVGPGPAPAPLRVTAGEFPAATGGKLAKRVLLPLPAAWEQTVQTAQAKAKEVRRLVLVARVRTSDDGHASGDALFAKAAAVFVFGP
ncbi:hypothetical protein [Parasulfuritortus cantonensis]|uniref:hypothetical protein n=1 Tax=Parasulfuritortus cantonensis TaxID=2528202 RepID=UPI001981BE74|nr:hypothetical protein [Parasulfuritortus cantonensis]